MAVASAGWYDPLTLWRECVDGEVSGGALSAGPFRRRGGTRGGRRGLPQLLLGRATSARPPDRQEPRHADTSTASTGSASPPAAGDLPAGWLRPDTGCRHRQPAGRTADPYLGAGRPDGLRVLPPPPAPGSPAQRLDRIVFIQSRAIRERDPQRWALARNDAQLDFDHLMADFACALQVGWTARALRRSTGCWRGWHSTAARRPTR